MSPRSVLLAVVLASACSRRDPSSTAQTLSAPASSTRVAWRPKVEIARGEAVRGEWKQNDSDFRWVDDPAVQLTASGDAIVAWVDQAEKDVLLGRWSRAGAPRMPPVNVSRSGATFSWLPRVVAAGDDVHVLWQEIVFSGGTHGGEIFVATSNDGGRTFRAPVNLSNSRAGDGKGRIDEKTWDNGSLDLARGARGELYAVWTEYEGALWLRRSDDGGATFAPAVRVAGTTEAPARGPSIAVARDGRVHLAWARGETSRAGIHVATSTDRGATFGPPAVIAGESGRADAPSIAIDEDGQSHLVFVENGRVGYARGSEEARWLTGEGARLPMIAIDGTRDIFVLYEREGTPRSRTQSMVLATSRNGGESFVESRLFGISGAAYGWNASQQGMLLEKMALSPSGGEIAIVNGTFLPDRESRIWLLRGALR